MKPGRLWGIYLATAIHWLNACLLFAMVTAFIGVGFFVLDKLRARGAESLYNTSAVHSLRADDAKKVFREFQRIGTTESSRPWIGFSEPPWHSQWVNIDSAEPVPVRRTPPPAKGLFRHETVIWLFGGSTAMGYGLPDDQTLAAQLQENLQRTFPATRVIVVNHAHLGHYSSQEVTLFQWLLRSGQHADLAIFLDGVNDASYALDKPDIDFDTTIVKLSQPWMTFSVSFPPVRLFHAIRKKLMNEPAANSIPQGEQLERHVTTVQKRYLDNVKLAESAGDAFGTATLFVWQPSSFDSMSGRTRGLELQGFEKPIRMINAGLRGGIGDRRFLFLADIFTNDKFLDTYVDTAHYGDAGTRKLASAIAQRITLEGH